MGHKLKCHDNLYHWLCAWDNLLLAYRKASKGKRGNPAVAAFEYRLEDNLIRLQEELVIRNYRPGLYYSFYIHDPKRRLISAAPFRDRVAHHGLCNSLSPCLSAASSLTAMPTGWVKAPTAPWTAASSLPGATLFHASFAPDAESSATLLWHPLE